MARENLKKARQQLGLTQQQMARTLGITRRYYIKIETGEKVGSVALWDRIEQLIQIPQQTLRALEATDLDLEANQ